MEALVILANFLAMGLVLTWCHKASRGGDKARTRGFLAFGDTPFEKRPAKKSKYYRE
jgi:hypothetical protein